MEHTRFDIAVINTIKDALIKKQQTLAVAESVTAGYLQTAFSLADNAMDFFQGGITAYNLGQKSRHLQIDPVYALSCDCVSERTAMEMAKNVIPLFAADWGIAITGYATPVPEKNIHELFACYAICFKGDCLMNGLIHAAKEDPEKVRYFFTNQLLSLFKQLVVKSPGNIRRHNY